VMNGSTIDNSTTIAIVGLGYVGLPLAVAFGNCNRTIGFDLNEEKLASYRQGIDPTGEVSHQSLVDAGQLIFTHDPTMLAEAEFVIVVVPTPIDQAHRPDLSPLEGVGQWVRIFQRALLLFLSRRFIPAVRKKYAYPLLNSAQVYPGWDGVSR